MKCSSLLPVAALVGLISYFAFAQSPAPIAGGGTQTVEYASVRFMEESSSIVWPDGTVQNLIELAGKKQFPNTKEKYPRGADFRMYWLTTAMNLLAQRGYEFAHMSEHDLVMKRSLPR